MADPQPPTCEKAENATNGHPGIKKPGTYSLDVPTLNPFKNHTSMWVG